MITTQFVTYYTFLQYIPHTLSGCRYPVLLSNIGHSTVCSSVKVFLMNISDDELGEPMLLRQ